MFATKMVICTTMIPTTMMVGQPVPTTAPPPMVIKGALHGNEMLYTKLQQFILFNILTQMLNQLPSLQLPLVSRVLACFLPLELFFCALGLFLIALAALVTVFKGFLWNFSFWVSLLDSPAVRASSAACWGLVRSLLS